MSDRLLAGTSTLQHTALTKHTAMRRWDSNRHFQQAIGSRPSPLIFGPLGLANKNITELRFGSLNIYIKAIS